MLTHVKFKFAIGEYNGTMSMRILDDGKEILYKPWFDQPVFEWGTVIEWPSVLTIELSGKDMNHDTKLEGDRVVADKYIQLQEFSVDRVSACLDNIELVTTDQTIRTLYWGFNGTVTIDCNSENSFVWHLQQKNKTQNANYVVDWGRTVGGWDYIYQRNKQHVQSKV